MSLGVFLVDLIKQKNNNKKTSSLFNIAYLHKVLLIPKILIFLFLNKNICCGYSVEVTYFHGEKKVKITYLIPTCLDISSRAVFLKPLVLLKGVQRICIL